MSPQGTPESPELIGTQIGNYRLSRLLGGGSMGSVYEAVHNQISRRVAVKVLHAHLSQDPEQRSRFLNEARAVSRVQHPGLIQIYDCGELPGGQIYIIMEFLEGAQLADRLQTAEPLPQGESLRIVHGMAQALAAAHQAGIIHRDLKPENVMLLGAPAVGTATADKVKVLDFGIAKILQSQVDARQTAPGSVLGTPLYMSPEQCVGNLVTDPRADVYALGVMLYELCCGRPPFVSDRFAFLMRMHVNEAPKPLIERNPAILPAVDALTMRMLAKKPADRPTMAQVAAELEQIILRHLGPTLENDRNLGQAVRNRLAAEPAARSAAGAAAPIATVIQGSGIQVVPAGLPAAVAQGPSRPPVDLMATIVNPPAPAGSRSSPVPGQRAAPAAPAAPVFPVPSAPHAAPVPAADPRATIAMSGSAAGSASGSAHSALPAARAAASSRSTFLIVAVAAIAAILGALLVAAVLRSAG